MLNKLKTLLVMLVLLTIVAVPMALAQGPYWDAPSDEPPASYWVYSPEMGQYVNCEVVDLTSPVIWICLENGIFPREEYAVHPDGGIVRSAEGPQAPPR